MSELTCRELIEFLDAYVGDELTPDRRAVFDAHLAVCRACRDYLSEYRRTIDLVRALGEAPGRGAVAAGVPEGLVRAVLSAVRNP